MTAIARGRGVAGEGNVTRRETSVPWSPASALVIRRHVQLACRWPFDLTVFVQNLYCRLKHSAGGARQQSEPCSSGNLELLRPGARWIACPRGKAMSYPPHRPSRQARSNLPEKPCPFSSTVCSFRSSNFTWCIHHVVIEERLLYCVEKYGVVIVVGQTGCGKTTRQW